MAWPQNSVWVEALDAVLLQITRYRKHFTKNIYQKHFEALSVLEETSNEKTIAICLTEAWLTDEQIKSVDKISDFHKIETSFLL